ncbi:MAG: pyruvate, phosphate dikinase [Deltaproteobacteria bacterium]|nr:pyruvate, phosphate dikinase [Deltaproteobacteria bacterium]
MFRQLDRLFKVEDRAAHIPAEVTEVQRKYLYFKQLLRHNHLSLNLINDLEDLLFGLRPFSYEEVLTKCEELTAVVYELVEDLNAVSQGKYPELFAVTERIGVQILRGLTRQKKPERTCLVLPLASLSHENQAQAGGKASNLGEIANRVGLPTPRGFVVTAYAGHHFLRSTGLYEAIRERFRGLDISDTDRLDAACRAVQGLIRDTELPEELGLRIRYEAGQLFRELGPGTRLAVRSSATGEDSESSFAGQHSTVLNVSEENVVEAYKEVVASMYSPRAVFYRRSMGYRDQDVVMCVLCLNMVAAMASGVLYTEDPNAPGRQTMIVSAAWGLGVSVVDGTMVTDHWEIDKSTGQVTEASVALKSKQIVMGAGGGLTEDPVDPAKGVLPCMDPAQLQLLAEYGLALERHYKEPLDIEWAVDQSGRLFILQARPLNPKDREPDQTETSTQPPEAEGHEILLSGGSTASAGAAFGPAFVLRSDHNLGAVPEGVILVTAKTSPTYVPLMNKIKGIVTDMGSVAGHMASVSREFGLPTLVGTERATAVLNHGDEITLDATNRVVYAGQVASLIRSRPKANMMKGGPLFRLVRDTLKKVVPLNLYDPKLPVFRPEGCLSLHDVVRYVHEKSMIEMFHLGQDIDDDKHEAVRLQTDLPLNTFVLDLGGGIESEIRDGTIGGDQVVSRPLQALLRGMSHPDVPWTCSPRTEGRYPCPLAYAPQGAERLLAGPNYAIVAREYLNYNARLGYHFVAIDAFCGDNVHDNYITFSFKGGAADVARRTRRARMVAGVLRHLGLRVEIRGDMVSGEIRKYDCPRMEDKLDQLGRLLGSVRFLDMVLTEDEQIPWYVEEFFKENYAFRH